MLEKSLNKSPSSTYNSMMMIFEICPICQIGWKRDSLKPMVLSGDDQKMQCDIYNHEFPIRQSPALLQLARRRREGRYGNV